MISVPTVIMTSDVAHPAPGHVVMARGPTWSGIGWLVGWLVSKSFKLRGQKQPTDSVKHVCSLVPSRITPFCPTEFQGHHSM